MTFTDCVTALQFYFITPILEKVDIQAIIEPDTHRQTCNHYPRKSDLITDHNLFVTTLKKSAQDNQIPLKELFWFVRLALTGKKLMDQQYMSFCPCSDLNKRKKDCKQRSTYFKHKSIYKVELGSIKRFW